MRHSFRVFCGLLTAFTLGFFAHAFIAWVGTHSQSTTAIQPAPDAGGVSYTIPVAYRPYPDNEPNLSYEKMPLGAFSISLSVKDLKASQSFYEALGFEVLGGSMAQHYLIMKNEHALIGLFQGMFLGNILTFNPGWDENAANLPVYEDIRRIQQRLLASGLSLLSTADTTTAGPASLMLKDPDDNLILIDQHR